jgi:L-asparaginase/Glu-tRNA(Gln) amidotransferase subunit D
MRIDAENQLHCKVTDMYANRSLIIKTRMNSKAKILLIYTGGTIGMRKDFNTGALKAFNFSSYYKEF